MSPHRPAAANTQSPVSQTVSVGRSERPKGVVLVAAACGLGLCVSLAVGLFVLRRPEVRLSTATADPTPSEPVTTQKPAIRVEPTLPSSVGSGAASASAAPYPEVTSTPSTTPSATAKSATKPPTTLRAKKPKGFDGVD